MLPWRRAGASRRVRLQSAGWCARRPFGNRPGRYRLTPACRAGLGTAKAAFKPEGENGSRGRRLPTIALPDRRFLASVLTSKAACRKAIRSRLLCGLASRADALPVMRGKTADHAAATADPLRGREFPLVAHLPRGNQNPKRSNQPQNVAGRYPAFNPIDAHHLALKAKLCLSWKPRHMRPPHRRRPGTRTSRQSGPFDPETPYARSDRPRTC